MSSTLCWKRSDLAFPIMLHQDGVDRFTVTYGKQITSGLSYGKAACELGAAVMHALACEGKLDNRERGER
jgi:hypothetical protein